MVSRKWIGGNAGAWEVAANWDPFGIPTLADDVTMTTGFATITTTIAINSITMSGSTIDVRSPGGTTTLTGGLTISAAARVSLDAAYLGGSGGNSLVIGGVLTNTSTDVNALSIGNSGITAATTVTATALVNTGQINIIGSAAAQSTLKINGLAGFGTPLVETGVVYLENNALLQFASGQIQTVNGTLWLNGKNARVANNSDPATNSALAELKTVAGTFNLQNGASVTNPFGFGFNITGTGRVALDASYIGGSGGSTLTLTGTLTNSSTDVNALSIGNSSITSDVTMSAVDLINSGQINIVGSTTAQASLRLASMGAFQTATGFVHLQNNALLEFTAGATIHTVKGTLWLEGKNAHVAFTGATTSNSALTGLGEVSGTFALEDGASVGKTTGDLSIIGTGRVALDAPYLGGSGGSTLSIGGRLTNSSTDVNALDIGNSSIKAADTVTAVFLSNTGRINIVGSAAAQSTLDITKGVASMGTAGVATGFVYLENNALLQFASGQFNTVAGTLWLNGQNARVADAAASSTNSALIDLATISGTFNLQNGASVGTTSGDLAITGTGRVGLDASYFGGNGGSTLKIGGGLTNSSTDVNALNIGNAFIKADTTVTATRLSNTGQINIVGSAAAQAALIIESGTAGFGTDGLQTGVVYLERNALLQFAGGQISTVKAGASLWLNGANARVADAGATSTNSALVGLSTVAGDVFLQNGATITTSGGLTISGTGRLVLDAPFIGGDGGSSLTVGGVLTNTSTDSNALVIGYFLQSTSDTVTATGLVNKGRLSIIGSTNAQSTLNITGGVAGFGTEGVMTGSAYLERNALLQFASGQIGTIESGASLWLNGANARVADAGATSTNSALLGLSKVAGDLFLQNGATVATSGDLTISGTGRVVLDAPFIGGAGGSTLTVGGVLSNISTDGNALVIGSAVQFASSTVTVAGLVNTGRLAMSGNTSAPTTLTVTGGPAGFGSAGVVTGSVYLEHDSLLQFASGQIGTVNKGASLWLNGASARVADAGATSTNSALVGLKSVAGDFILQNGGTVATSGDLTISGTGRLLLDAPFLGGVGRSSLTVGGVLTNNSTDGNALAIGNSFITKAATVTAAGLVNTGTIQLFGSATAHGSLTISGAAQNSGTIFVNAGGLLTDPLSLTSSGALKLAGGTIDVPTLTIARTGTLGGNGTIDGSVVNGGNLEATGGLLAVSGTISGNGVIKIGASATLELGSGSPLAIFFNGASATLRLDTPGDFKGTLIGFDAQDKIDLRGIAGGTSATLDADHVLHVFNAGKVELAALQLTASNSGQSFTVGSDGSGGTLITGGAITLTAPVYNGVFQLFGPANFDYTSMFPDKSLATAAALSNIDAGGLRQKYVVSYNNGIQVEFDGAGLTLGAGGKFDPAGGTVDTVIVSVLGAGGQTTKLASFTSDAANGHAMLEKFDSTILSGGSGYYERLLSGDNSIIGSQSDDLIVDYWGINTIDGSGGYNTLYFGPAVTYLHVTSGNQPTDPLGIGSLNFIDDTGSSSFSNVNHLSWDQDWPYGPPPDAEPPGPPPPDDDDGVDDYNDHNDQDAGSDNRTPNDGGGFGDPHLLTFDGGYYDFMAVGEFVMARSTVAGDSFEVQIRTSAFAGSSMVSAISGIAVKIGNQRVTFDQSRPEIVWVDGSPVSFMNNTYALAGGRIDLVGQGRYDVVDSDGEVVHVLAWGAYFDVRVSPGDGFPLSKMQGLLGNADGLAGNDFALEDGTVLAAPLTSAQLYGVFADAWRVEQATSLLDYAAGQSTATFTNKSFPQTAIADLPLDLVTRATILATQAGITDPGLRQQAVLDYIATGDPTLITLAANQQQHGIQTVTIAQPTGGPASTVALGIAAVMSEVVETHSGTTGIAFQVYRTGNPAGNLAVTYKVTAPGAGYFDASDFGGALPSSQVTLLDGQSSTTFTINIPNNVITAASELLRVEISATNGTPIFASTAQVEVHNNQPVAGSHAAPAFLKFQGLGTLTQVGNAWTLNLGALVQGQTIADVGVAVANLVASPGNDLSGTFGLGGSGFTLTGATAFTGLAAGAEKAFSVGVDTSTLGARSLTLTLHSSESNDTGFSAALADQTLTISGTIVAAGTALVSIAAQSADKAEGNTGMTAFTFTVTRSGDTSGAQTVAWSILGSGVNGAGPDDFGPGPLDGGTVTFAAGETAKTVSIPVVGDTTIETDEQFTISLEDPSAGLTIQTGSAIGTIRNDDGAPPTVAISATAAVKAEGSGTTAFTFTVTRTGSAAAGATVSYAVTGSVTNPADAADFVGNVLPSGVVTFAAGETTKTLSIGVAGDATVEPDNGFIVTLSSPSAGLALGAASANGTILNDDLRPHDDAYVILQGKSLTAAAAVGVLSNDETTPPVTAALQGNVAHGQLQLAADGGVTYTPTSNFAGIDTFSYHAAGANGAGGDGQAQIYVVPVQVFGASTTLNLLALSADQQIASTYVAFFGRAADADGFEFWVGQFVQGLPTQGAAALFANIASSFAISEEAKALYPFLVNPFGASDSQISAFIDSVYNNLFNRSSDTAGLDYWTGQIKQTLAANQFVGSVLINIMSGAQDSAAGKDITSLMGKVAVSLEYIHEQQAHNTIWAGASDIAAATALLDAVTDAPQAILTGIRNAETLIANHV